MSYKRKGGVKLEKNMSKRNYKRILKKQSILYKNRGNAEVATVQSDSSSFEDFMEPIDGFSELGEDIVTPCEKLSSPKLNLREKLKKWYIETAPSRKFLENLLAILQEEGLEVPLSAAALLGKKDKVAIKKVFPGSYCHIGLENQLKKVGDVLKNYDEVQLDINIDGIPLFKSSRIQLWPILLKITNLKEKVRPFPVGIYVGHAKPSCVTEFCKDFVEEVLLLKDGFILNERKIKIVLRCLTCDTPAKAFVCGIPGHTSSHGCSKCTQVAKKVGSVLTYSTVSGTLISDEDFSLRKYPKHHNQKFKDANSPLEQIGFNMVSQTPLDSMHLIDLGVTRKMLIRIIKNRTEEKTPKSNISAISSELVNLRKKIPKEFPRKPRSLDEIHNWKATEFHQFLAYTGLIVLYNNVHKDIFYEFLLLHCAYRLLSNPRHVYSNVTEANDLLQLFVENFPIVFGPDSVSYNVHNLLHIAASAERYGTLMSFSAYDFENKLQILKKHVRKPSSILQQIVQREQHEIYIDPKTEKFKYKGGVIIEAFVNDCIISCKEPNNIFSVKYDIPVKIESIIKGDENIYVEARRLLDLDSFFQEPLNSCALGIFKTNLVLGEKEVFLMKDVLYKFLCLPFDSNYVIIPILHSCLPLKCHSNNNNNPNNPKQN